MRRNLAGIDLIGQIAIHHPFCPDGRAQRGILRIGAGNAGNQPIGLAEIESGIKTQRHDGRGGSGRPNPSQHSHDALIVHAQVVVALGKRIDVGQVFAFDPVLILARSVALIGSGLKQRDHDDFDGDGRGRISAGSRQDAEEEGQQSSAHTGA